MLAFLFFACLWHQHSIIQIIILLLLDQIDREGANPERVMQELSSIGLMPEDWGGDVPMVQVIVFCSIPFIAVLYFFFFLIKRQI